jgi:anti-sigma-K factor RskA
MELSRHPELADRIAAAYGLGTLRGGARRRFEAQARQSPQLRALAIVWQERFAAMTELQPTDVPSPNVWKRIRLELDRQRDAGRARASSPASRGWRGFALAGAFAAVVGITTSLALFTQLRASPEIRYVAVLADDKSAPSVLVTFDPKHNTLTLKRVGDFSEGAEKSLQLWALPPGSAPRSLGVLPTGGIIRLPAAESQMRVPALAISLEPKGGVPGDKGPTGPVLFKGALLPTS